MQDSPDTTLKNLVSKSWFEPLSNFVLLALYFIFLYNHLLGIKTGIISSVVYVFIAMESTVILLLILRQKPKTRITEPIAWICAFIGTFATLFLLPSPAAPFPTIGTVLMIIGGVLATLSYLSLNTSFGVIPAIRNVKTSGLYSVIRHPMYSSYFVIYTGYLMLSFSLYNLAIISILFIFLVLRIHFEEKILTTNNEYVTYKNRVRYRLLPGIY